MLPSWEARWLSSLPAAGVEANRQVRYKPTTLTLDASNSTSQDSAISRVGDAISPTERTARETTPAPSKHGALKSASIATALRSHMLAVCHNMTPRAGDEDSPGLAHTGE